MRGGGGNYIGAWSISVRQTNVVWLAFILAVSLLRGVSEVEEREGKKGDEKGGEVGRSDPLLGEVFGLCKLV